MSGAVVKKAKVGNFTKELHAHLIRTRRHTNSNFMSVVLKSYALCPSTMCKARFAFHLLEEPTLPIWNFMIRGVSYSDQPDEALKMFEKMRDQEFHGNNLTFIHVLKASARVADVSMGKRVHALAVKLGFRSYLYVNNALIHMYALCGALDFAREVFYDMPERDIVSWNSLICGYSQFDKNEEILDIFHEMQQAKVKADAVTMVKVLFACKRLGDREITDSMTKFIKNNSVEIDVYLGNTLIDMYGERGSLDLAQEVFNAMHERNVTTWNILIKGYSRVGNLEEARKLFLQMPKRDVVSWTSIIVGYCQAKLFAGAVALFQEMMAAKVKPDEITIASVFSACARLGRLDIGRTVHNYVKQHDMKIDTCAGNALIDMYCKCGSISRALEVFYEMKVKDSVSWTSVISGLALNGSSDHALELFSQMLIEGVRPTHGTYVGILLACAHGGLVEKGLDYFNRMKNVHGLVPEMKHYGCMVDLFGRAGYLDKAYEFIEKMPIVPDIVVWRILLGACKLHRHVLLAEIVSRKLLELDPDNAGNYVLSSSAFASAERWHDATRMRQILDEDDVLKPLGWSSVEVNGVT